MDDHIYKHVKVTGSSDKSIEDAVNNALGKATQTVRNMRWFQVVETRGSIADGHVGHWQVTIEIGFRLSD
jgi:flavin-binding protein dodecin